MQVWGSSGTDAVFRCVDLKLGTVHVGHCVAKMVCNMRNIIQHVLQ